MSGKNNLEENIIKDLKKTGYPVEIDVTEILEKDGWTVYNQEGYFDQEENKWRTIDVVAFKVAELSNSSTYKRLHISLCIECKTGKDEKGDKPWVFYMRNKDKMRTFDPVAATRLVKQVSWPFLNYLSLEKIINCFHYFKYRKVGVIPIEPFTSGKGEKIFRARNQVVKFTEYEIKKRISQFVKLGEIKPIFSLIYPVIVFDGKLYELYSKEELHPSEYLQYLASHGFSIEKEELYLVDIVRFDFIEKYIKMIDEEFESLKEKIDSLKFLSSENY